MMNKSTKACLALLAAFVAGESAQAQTVTPAMSIPAARVDTTKPGFRYRVYRGTSALNANNVASSEAYISGMPFNPGNLAPLNIPNASGLNYDLGQPEAFYETRWWIVPYVNFQEQVNGDDLALAANPTAGNFHRNQAAPHNVADRPVPGITTWTDGSIGSGQDYYVVEATGWVELRSGTTRFGVSSDDGFRLLIGAGADLYAAPAGSTPNGVQLIVLDGTRGVANTEANITVNQAGFYPIRLTWWESTGATASCELYTFGPGATSGSRYLIGDTAQANAVKVYSALVDQPAQLTGRFPLAGATGVPARPQVKAILENGAAPIDQSSITLTVDGTPVTDFTLGPSPEGSVTNVKLETTQGVLGPYLPGTVHTVVLAGLDTSATPIPFSYTWTFTVANYPTLPADFKVSAANVEAPGFRTKIEHTGIVNTGPQTSQSWAAERRMARGYRDPATGEPYPNLVDLTGADAEGYFTDPDVVNWNDAAGGAAGSFPNDEAHPAGLVAASERFVASIETFLELQPGIYRLGVNSDDGFRLTAGRAPGDVTGIEVAVANADRGPTDTYGDVNITEAGFYPFRVMWWETGGGAAAEFFLVAQNGEKILINDPNNPNAVKAFRESANTAPAVTRLLPTVNDPYVYADQDIEIEITEKSIQADLDSISMTINGATQTLTKERVGNMIKVLRDSTVDNLLPSGAVTVVFNYSYTPAGGSTINASSTWSYYVPAYTRVIPAANRVPAEQVSGDGFKVVRVHQLDRSGDANQGNGGRRDGNNWPGAEIQMSDGYRDLADAPFANKAAAPFNLGPVGDVDVPWVNFNWTTGGTGNAGLFNGDARGPGLPGTGTSNAGLDNSVHEFHTFLDLKKGAYVFAVNVDDGFTMHSSPNPNDTLGTLVGWKAAPGGGFGFPINNPQVAFNVVVPEDGIYPFRTLFWQGGGGVNVEILNLDRDTGVIAPINMRLAGDSPNLGAPYAATGHVPAQPGAPVPPYKEIKAYSTYTGPVRPWTKFSVFPPRSETAFFNNPYQQTGPGPINVRLPNSGNPADVANINGAIRPFGDAVGAIVADAGDATIGMKVDGQVVTPVITDLGNGEKKVLYTPATPLTPGAHTAALIYAGAENTWTFNTIDHVTANVAAKADAARADETKRGFLIKVAQSTTARGGANSGNNAASAELQLTGTPANIAPANVDRPDGAYVNTGFINYNNTKNQAAPGGDNGNFTAARTSQADIAFPAIASANLNNFTVEAFAWLQLPRGYQKFAVNADDGAVVKIGQLGDASGQTLFTIDRGGGSADMPFAFWVEEAGLYPVRVVYYQGTGGGNFEFFSFGENNSKILVNDASNPASIKAYYEISGGQPGEPEITITSYSNGILRLSWTNGGTLETAATIPGAGPVTWTSTGDSDGSAEINVPTDAAGSLFIRINRAP